MTKRYTKSDLEGIVSVKLENLNAMHGLLSMMKHQNELLEKANKKLKDEVSDFEQKVSQVTKKAEQIVRKKKTKRGSQ